MNNIPAAKIKMMKAAVRCLVFGLREEVDEALVRQVGRVRAGVLDGVGSRLGAWRDQQREHRLVQTEAAQLALMELGRGYRNWRTALYI